MVCYEEEIMVGYRHYEKNDILPMFCFGHGLSYTEFAYHDLQVKQDNDANDRVSISFDIENVGQIDGREIVQIYVRDEECTVIRPEKELKAFKSITLKALAPYYYREKALGHSTEKAGRLILKINALPADKRASFSAEEIRLMRTTINQLRNERLAKGQYTDAADDMLLKLY